MKKGLLLLLILVAGCSSKTSIQHRQYMLPTLSVAPVAKQTAPILLVKTELADYLGQRGLVYRTSQAEVIYAKHHQWVQDISQQLTYRIINDLRAKQTHYWPVGVNSSLDLDKKTQLHIRLFRFNGVFTGVAEIAGEWLLVDEEGKIKRDEPFSFEVPLAQEGYEALIAALSDGLSHLTNEIAAQL
jgi:hypothetical protein